MLPPTIIIAPTSDNALPSPAIPFTVNSCLDSQIKVLATLNVGASIEIKYSLNTRNKLSMVFNLN